MFSRVCSLDGLFNISVMSSLCLRSAARTSSTADRSVALASCSTRITSQLTGTGLRVVNGSQGPLGNSRNMERLWNKKQTYPRLDLTKIKVIRQIKHSQCPKNKGGIYTSRGTSWHRFPFSYQFFCMSGEEVIACPSHHNWTQRARMSKRRSRAGLQGQGQIFLVLILLAVYHCVPLCTYSFL